MVHFKKIAFLILAFVLITMTVDAQEIDKTFFCGVSSSYVGLEPLIHENSTDTVLKIQLKELNTIDYFFLNKSGFDLRRTDTISKDNPISNLIGENDQLVEMKDFVDIVLKEVSIDSNEVVYEQHIDFIGDNSLDKIELKYAKYTEKGVRPLIIGLYENINGNYTRYSHCDILLWEKPLSIYISQIKKLDMALIIFNLQSDIPDQSKLFNMIYADRIEKEE